MRQVAFWLCSDATWQRVREEAIRIRTFAGLAASTPAIAVQDGTTATQRVVAAPLAELASAVACAELRSPTLILIGHVPERGTGRNHAWRVTP